MENVKTETVVTLELSVAEANLVLNALRELPHRISDDLIRKILTQGQKQSGNLPPVQN